MTTYFTSDRHFFHKNMTKEGTDFCGRGFDTVEEMNEYIIEIHNETVGLKDTLIDCGDISLYNGKPEQLFKLLKRMNGNFIIIRGNHDSQAIVNYLLNNNYSCNGKQKFEIHDVGYRFKHNKNIYYCTHYPLEVGERGNVYNIHGHIHSKSSECQYQTNIGIDSPEYSWKEFATPLTIEDIEHRFNLNHITSLQDKLNNTVWKDIERGFDGILVTETIKQRSTTEESKKVQKEVNDLIYGNYYK